MFRDDPEICTWELLPLSCTPSLYQLSVIPGAAKYPQVKEAVSPLKLYRLLLGDVVRIGGAGCVGIYVMHNDRTQ